MVGTKLRVAVYLERGTGLYGPRNRWIVPRKARALRFPAGGGHTFDPSTGAHTSFVAGAGFTLSGRRRSGRAGARAQYVFVRRVRGIRPRRYGHDAALRAAPRVQAIFATARSEMTRAMVGAA